MCLPNPRRALLAAGIALSCLLTGSTRAGVVLSWSLNEGYFDAVVSGSLSSGELAQAGFIFSQNETASAFMDTQPYFASFPAGTHQRVLFLASDVTFTPNFIRLNSYSGNTRSGDVFGFFKTSFNDLMMILPSGYQADTPLNATFRSFAYGNSLNNAFTFGDVVKVNGAPLITFAAVAPVPEPATYAMGLVGLAGGAYVVRWRRKRA